MIFSKPLNLENYLLNKTKLFVTANANDNEEENTSNFFTTAYEWIQSALAKIGLKDVTHILPSVFGLVSEIWRLSIAENGPGSIIYSIGVISLFVGTIVNHIVRNLVGSERVDLALSFAKNWISDQYHSLVGTVTANADGVEAGPIPNPEITGVAWYATLTKWIAPVISVIAALTAFIAPALGFDPMKIASNINTTLTCSDKLTKSATDSVHFLAETLAGVDVTGDIAYTETMTTLSQEALDIMKTPTETYMRKAKLRRALFSFPDRASIATNKKCEKSTHLAVSEFKKTIQNGIKNATEKITDITSALDNSPRPPTLGQIFYGNRAVGKSKFTEYQAAVIASRLDWEPDLYSIRKAGDFHDPYSYQKFGVCNEWLATMGNDPNISNLTEIASGEYYNMEGAFVKKQPCELTLLTLTTNDADPAARIHRVLSGPAVTALFDRFIRVEIIDPANPNRHDPNSGNHRRPDFEHLTLRVTISDEDQPAPHLWHEISVSAYINYITVCLAMRQELFLTTNNTPVPANITQTINKYWNSYANVQNILHDHVENYQLLEPRLQANEYGAGSQRFFVVRLQGDPNTGKTTQAEYISQALSRHYYMPVVNVDDSFSTNCQNASIFLIDDLLTKNNSDEYHKWINNQPKGSIYIIVTNHNIRKERSRRNPLTPCYNVTEWGSHSGIARRLGIAGYCRHNNEFFTTPATDGILVESSINGLTVEGKSYNPGQLLEFVFKQYSEFIKSSAYIETRHLLMEIPNADIVVKASDYETFKRYMASKTLLTKAYMMPSDEFSVKLSNDKVYNDLSIVASATPFMMPNLDSIDDFIQSMRVLLSKLALFTPGFTCSFHIREPSVILSYKDNTLYIGSCEVPCEGRIEIEGDNVRYVRNEDFDIIITMEEYALARVTRKTDHPLNGLLMTEHITIQNFIDKNPALRTTYKHHYQKIKNAQDVKNKAKEYSILKPVLICSAVIAALVGGVALITYLCRRKSDISANNHPYPEDEPIMKEFIGKMQRTGRNRSDLAQLDAQAKREMNIECYEYFQNQVHDYYAGDWSSNSVKTATDYVAEADFKGLQEHWKLNPNDMPTISNAVRAMDITFQQKNQLDNIAGILKKNYCTIYNKTARRNAFALGITGNILISVSHIVVDMDDDIEIMNDGAVHSVKCVRVNREKDLAIFKLEKASFSFKDIRNHFTSTLADNITTEGYFIRAVEGDTTVGHASIRLTTKRQYPLVDANNPQFHPSEGLIVATFASFVNTPAFIKRGDCGFPLIARVGTELKVIGIHNAICSSSIAFFSLVSDSEINFLCNTAMSNSGEDENLFVHAFEPSMKIDKFYSSKMENSRPSTKNLPNTPVFGFCPDIKLHSNPKNAHYQILNDQDALALNVSNPTKPSALTYVHGMKTEKLIQDKKGRWQTLDAQCVKYSKRLPTYKQWDQKLYDLTINYVAQRIETEYGTNKDMNLTSILNGYLDDSSKPFDPKTSAGPYIKLKYGETTKETLLVNKNPVVGARPYWELSNSPSGQDVREKFNEIVSQWEQGISPVLVCKDNRKVELLPADKVDEGKVRLFNELDFHVNMALKKFFGNMSAEVIKNHLFSPWKLGMNPYSDYTVFWKTLHEVDGPIIATDISGCDKSFPKELIENFCNAMLKNTPETTRKAIAKSLTYTMHIVDGTVYFVENGNESGIFLTTLLNCYGMEFFYTYAVIKKLTDLFGRAPLYAEVQDHFRFVGFGDDILAKFDKTLSMSTNDLVQTGALFNFTVTPAKGSELSFCSRDFNVHQGIVYPSLKASSILSGLFWSRSLTPKQISQNIQIVMFEASLHPREFFDKVRTIALYLVKKYRLRTEDYAVCTYEQYREFFLGYICGGNISPILIGIGEPDLSDSNKTLTSNSSNSVYSYALSPTLIQTNLQVEMDPISQLTNRSTTSGTPLNFKCSQTGPRESPTWNAQCQFGDIEKTAQAKTKQTAKSDAAKLVLETFVQANCGHLNAQNLLPYPPTTPEDFNKLTKVCVKHGLEKVGVAYLNDSNQWSINCTPAPGNAYFIDTLAEANESIVVDEKSITINLNDTLTTKTQFTLSYLAVLANAGDMPIEPAVMNQAAQGQQYMDLPSRANPQPTAIAPAMTSGGDDIVAAVGITPPETLNPIGAPNMLGVGAITFDIKELVYNQFIDSDKQITVSDTATEGSIIAQIPYAFEGNDYLNGYIKYYANTHERYSGSFQYRFTVIGNPLFSGAIGIAWYPNKLTGSTAPISELMKYSYQAESVTNPWNKIHLLHDARKSDFYRTTDETGVANRPHLVIFLLMSLQNPLKEGVQTRIRIASKLSNAGEPNPFVFANPVLPTARMSSPAALPGLKSPPNTTTTSIFPSLRNVDLNIATDGNKAYPQVISSTPQLPIVEESGNFGTSSCRTILRNQLWGSNINQDEYRLNVDTPFSTDTPTVAFTYWSTNIPATQFNLLQEAMRITRDVPSMPRLSSRTVVESRVYTGSDLDYMDKMFRTDVPNVLGSSYQNTGFNLMSVFRYKPANTKGPDRFGGYKLVTTHGIAYFSIVVSKREDPVGPLLGPGANNIGYTAIDIPFTIKHPFTWQALPAGYKRLSFTSQTVSAFTSKYFSDPSLYDDVVILKYFESLAAKIDPVECLQFRLIDPISQSEIATVRFLQEFNCFAVRSSNAISSFLPKRLSQLAISKIETVKRTSAFNITNDATWVERATSNELFARSILQNFESDDRPFEVQSNAMIAAGAAAGLTSGIFGAMDKQKERKQQLTMQNNMFTHERGMQNSSFSHDTQMQKALFGQQTQMQGNLFNQQTSLQNSQNEFTMDYGKTMAGVNYSNSDKLQTSSYDLSDRNADRQMDRNLYMAGARAPVSGNTLASSTA